MPSAASTDVSLLVLCRNAGAAVKAERGRITEILDAIESDGYRVEAILEEDGSTDDTPGVIDALAKTDPRFRTKHHAQRQGKGGGLILAAEAARGRFLVMSDADSPTDAETMRRIVNTLKEGVPVVLPSRRHPDSHVRGVPLVRRFFSKGFNLYANALLGVRSTDTQCGVKGFTREAFSIVKPSLFPGYEMDLEILCRARRAGLEVREIPINYFHGPNSGIRLSDNVPYHVRSILRLRRAQKAGAFDPGAKASVPMERPRSWG